MRKIIVLAAAIAWSAGCFGQNSAESADYSARKNEVNLGFFNVFDLYATPDFGVGYKISGERGAFRLGSSFRLNRYERDGEDYQLMDKSFRISPRIGYEFHQDFKRLRLYYGADVVTSFYKAVNEQTFPVIDPYETEIYTIRSNEYGLSPVLGLNVFLSKSVSLSTETHLNVLFSKSVIEDDDSSPNTTTSRGMNVGLSPLGIVSINFHF